MLIDVFPLTGLRLRTTRLELRLPTPDELGELAELAAGGVHDPAEMPFSVPWTDLPGPQRAMSVVQHHWRTLAAITPQAWSLPLAVFRDGAVVGQQTVAGRDFAVTREVTSGSWLGLRHHRHGIGTEMRAAVLHLAFAGIHAHEAASAAYDFNTASLGVSSKLGYTDDGVSRHVVRGQLTISRRLRLTRAARQQHATIPVEVDGLEPCLPLLGAS